MARVLFGAFQDWHYSGSGSGSAYGYQYPTGASYGDEEGDGHGDGGHPFDHEVRLDLISELEYLAYSVGELK